MATLKKRPAVFDLFLNEHTAIPVEQIGKGRYTTAYRELARADTVYLAVKDGDASKEILSHLDPNPHLPRMERIGLLGERYLYQSTYYEPLRVAHKDAWKDLKLIRKIREDAYDSIILKSSVQTAAYWHLAYQVNELIVEELAQVAGSTDLVVALRELATEASNYGGTYLFEFTVKNCGVGTEGQLVLVDPLFDMEEVCRTNRERMKKMRGY